MANKVVKFGGSSLADANQFRKVADIIKSDSKRIYVVPSAPGKRFSDDIKITDMLYKCCELAGSGVDFSEDFQIIKDRYNGIISDLGIDMVRELDIQVIPLTAIIEGKEYLNYPDEREITNKKF